MQNVNGFMVVLTKDISFVDPSNQTIVFSKGEAIYVDLNSLIAYGKGLHFTVEHDEFTLVQ
jgi:hypothetical protein